MKKVIRLTESDLVKIVERVLKEQSEVSDKSFKLNTDLGELGFIDGNKTYNELDIINTDRLTTKDGRNVINLTVGKEGLFKFKVQVTNGRIFVDNGEISKTPQSIIFGNKQYKGGDETFKSNVVPRIKKYIPETEYFLNLQKSL